MARQSGLCATCGAELQRFPSRISGHRYVCCDMLCYRWWPVKQHADYSSPMVRQILRAAVAVSTKRDRGVGTFKPLRQRYAIGTTTFTRLTRSMGHPSSDTVAKLERMVKEVLNEQERLGHATPGFTLAVYSHVLPGMQEAASTQNAEWLLGVLPTASNGTGENGGETGERERQGKVPNH